jgi:hypothetical protein
VNSLGVDSFGLEEVDSYSQLTYWHQKRHSLRSIAMAFQSASHHCLVHMDLEYWDELQHQMMMWKSLEGLMECCLLDLANLEQLRCG